MKVGIITKHRIHNYGSFMQAYGLQNTIEKLGYEVEIIDYLYPNSFHPTHNTILGQVLHIGNYILKNLLPGFPGYKFVKRYNDCFARYYHLSRRFNTQEDLMQNPPLYDCYVAGSDQIWRPKFTNGDPVFFADFAPAGRKRISYASSFGCLNIPTEFRKSYSELISKFEMISVRESSGVSLVRELTNLDAKQVLDPSLLLTGEEWRRMEILPKTNRKYVVCYGRVAMNFVHKLAHDMAGSEYDVVRINGKFIDFFKNNEHYILDAGPREWLGLIDAAEIVVIGGSFHGTAFSIQFHKPFLSVLSGNEDHDSRQISLLNALGLYSNGIYEGDYDSQELCKVASSINWEQVDLKLEELREESLGFLKEALAK